MSLHYISKSIAMLVASCVLFR